MSAVGLQTRSTPSDVASAVESVIADLAPNHRAVRTGPNTWRFVRSVRPAWASLLGWLTMPLFGLGALVLSLRRQESFTMVLSGRFDGTVLSFAGDIPHEIPKAIARALSSADGAEPGRPVHDGTAIGSGQESAVNRAGFAAAPAAPILLAVSDHPMSGQVSTERGERTAAERLQRAMRPFRRQQSPVDLGPSLSLRFASGESCPIAPDGLLLVGRAPAIQNGATVVRVDDDEASRLHFSLRSASGKVMICDEASTNGTTLGRGRLTIDLVPHQPVEVEAGDQILFGVSSATVTRS